jgi:hypothetical protein
MLVREITGYRADPAHARSMPRSHVANFALRGIGTRAIEDRGRHVGAVIGSVGAGEGASLPKRQVVGIV